ncbi:MAG: hypothetical protein HY905_10040 [Deltaproteobacteria bacterium]|nr:hypothetical protein [Deltaproteobacteria bacterium]
MSDPGLSAPSETDEDIWAAARREFPDDYALQQVHVARRRLLREIGPVDSPRFLAQIAELARRVRERSPG